MSSVCRYAPALERGRAVLAQVSIRVGMPSMPVCQHTERTGQCWRYDIDTSGIASIWHVSTPSEAGETCWLNIDTSVRPVCRYVSTPSEAERCWLSIDTSVRQYARYVSTPARRGSVGWYRYVGMPVCRYVSTRARQGSVGASVCRRCRYVSTPSEAGQCWLSIDTSVRQYAGMPARRALSKDGAVLDQYVDTSIHRYVNPICQYV
jgi:hypothetical protein